MASDGYAPLGSPSLGRSTPGGESTPINAPSFKLHDVPPLQLGASGGNKQSVATGGVTMTARRSQINPYSAGTASRRVSSSPQPHGVATQRRASTNAAAPPSAASLFSAALPIDRFPPVHALRVGVVGAPKSGKTQLCSRFLTGRYDRNYTASSKITSGSRLISSGGTQYLLEVWDLPGAGCDSLLPHVLPRLDGVVIVADAADLRSFQVVKQLSALVHEAALTRLADNLSVMAAGAGGGGESSLHDSEGADGGGDDDLALHSLPSEGSLDGSRALVSALPSILFASKGDLERVTLSRGDMLESASHFKLGLGVLGSALVDRTLVPEGAPAVPQGATVSPTVAAAAHSLAAHAHPADGGVEQAFMFLLREMLKYQHLLSISPALQHARATEPSAAGASHPPTDRDLHSLAALHTDRNNNNGLTSRRSIMSASGPAMPLPASLASLRQKSTGAGGRGPSAFHFGAAAGDSPSLRPTPAAPVAKTALAAVQARHAAEAAAEKAAQQQAKLQAAAESSDEDESDDDASSSSEEDDDEEDEEDEA